MYKNDGVNILFCNQCGKQLEENSKFCNSCGCQVGDKLYDITAFSIERNELVGAIITDVTKTELGREKIAHRAQEVISKNIAIVQEIACLLGEHMVETELLLSTIAQDYDYTEEKQQ